MYKWHNPLQFVNEFDDWGVVFDWGLEFNSYVDVIIRDANRMIGFIKLLNDIRVIFFFVFVLLEVN